MDLRERFTEIVDDLAARDPDVEETQMMGRPSIKVAGKLIACFESRGAMAFKLPDADARNGALALEGAQPYDPGQTGRIMGGWVEIPAAQASSWPALAETALRLRKENP